VAGELFWQNEDRHVRLDSDVLLWTRCEALADRRRGSLTLWLWLLALGCREPTPKPQRPYSTSLKQVQDYIQEPIVRLPHEGIQCSRCDTLFVRPAPGFRYGRSDRMCTPYDLVSISTKWSEAEARGFIRGALASRNCARSCLARVFVPGIRKMRHSRPGW